MNPSAPNQPDAPLAMDSVVPGQGQAAPAPGQQPVQPPAPGTVQPGLPQAQGQPAPGQTGAVQQGGTGKKDKNKAGSKPNSTQNSLQIAEIRDGIVIMNDGSFRSVVMVKSINFDLMSPQEKEAVEYSYQGFLNSLYFPIQIFLRSQKVDLRIYIEKLDKIRAEHDNMLLALLMEDYITYIDQLSQQTNIMDKKFYVVIPYFPVVEVQKALTNSKNFLGGVGKLFNKSDQHVVINEADLEEAKTELRNRVQAVLAGLQQCGVQGLPLDTQELIELYYDTYNPDTATRQQLKELWRCHGRRRHQGPGQCSPAPAGQGAGVMLGRKKKQQAPTDPAAVAQAQHQREEQEVQAAFQKGITALRDFIAPSSLEFSNTHFQIGTRYARTYYVFGYPRQLYTGWLSSMVNLDEIIDLSLYIYPVESQVVLENLRKKVTQLEAGIQIEAEKGRVRDPGKQAAIQDAEEMRDKLQVGEERFFRLGFYFTLYGSSQDELEYVAHKVESMLGQQLVYSKPATSQQEQGLNSTIPQMVDQLQIRRNLSTGALSTSFPFTSADLSQDKRHTLRHQHA